MQVMNIMSQAIVVGAMSSRVADIDTATKDMIETSSAAKVSLQHACIRVYVCMQVVHVRMHESV